MLIEENNGSWIVVLDKDQEIMSTLTEVAVEKGIKGGQINGIGAVKDVNLGVYLLEKQEYLKKDFTGEDYELISLSGNISLKDGKEFCHVHTALGREDFSMFGGHLFSAKVAVTAEIYITPFGVMPERALNHEVGLATIQHCRIN